MNELRVIVDGDAIVLTKRQHEILRLLGEGDGDKEMARKLAVAPSTVRDHATKACHALGGRNRTHACAIAVRLGVI